MAFGVKAKYVRGVGLLMQGDVIERFRTANLKAPVCCVAQGVITLCSVPVAMTVAQ